MTSLQVMTALAHILSISGHLVDLVFWCDPWIGRDVLLTQMCFQWKKMPLLGAARFLCWKLIRGLLLS